MAQEKETIRLPDIRGDVLPFSTSYLDWLDKYGFYVRETWNMDTNKWGGMGYLALFESQRRILGYSLNMSDGIFPFRTILYSCLKKSGKTIISASVGGWYSEVAPPGSEIYILANSQEHAEGRVMRDLKFHAERRGWKTGKFTIYLPNGTFIQALAQSAKTVSGSRHALTLFDELWGVTDEGDRRVYEELTPIATIPHSLRFISTYAGYINESDLLWDLYVNGVMEDEHPDGKGMPISELDDLPCSKMQSQFTYWDHEPRLPWQTEEYYEEQRNTLRPAAYLRLHENRWVTTHESFIPIEWWDRSTLALKMSADIWEEHPYRHLPVYVAVDAAPKHDCTSIVGTAYDAKNGRIGVVFHKIWTPHDTELDFEATIEPYLIEKSKKFRVASISYDPAHLHQTMVRLRRLGLPLHEFTQTPANMTKASQNLYDIMKMKAFEAYPDDEARSHLLNTVALVEGGGFRIVKSSQNKNVWKPIDFTVALAMSAYDAVSSGGIDLSVPIEIHSPFADMGELVDDSKLPWMFKE